MFVCFYDIKPFFNLQYILYIYILYIYLGVQAPKVQEPKSDYVLILLIINNFMEIYHNFNPFQTH